MDKVSRLRKQYEKKETKVIERSYRKIAKQVYKGIKTNYHHIDLDKADVVFYCNRLNVDLRFQKIGFKVLMNYPVCSVYWYFKDEEESK